MADFRSAATASVEPCHRVRRRLREARLVHGVGRGADTLVALWNLLKHRPDLVYVNSTAAAVYLRPARWLRRRVVLHAHESGPVASEFLDVVRVRRSLTGVEVVACSPSVRSELAALTGRNVDEVSLLLSVPDEEDVKRRAAAADDDIDPGVVVVGCCGTAEHRKGVDLWLDAARRVLAESAVPVRFVWVGDVRLTMQVDPDLPITFLGPRDNPYGLMRRFDIATVPSRDDPFPLVVLESMLLGVPVVAFGVGGVPQQVGDAGVVVDPGDVAGFADAILGLVADANERHRLSAAGQARVRDRFSPATFAAQLISIVDGTGNSSVQIPRPTVS